MISKKVCMIILYTIILFLSILTNKISQSWPSTIIQQEAVLLSSAEFELNLSSLSRFPVKVGQFDKTTGFLDVNRSFFRSKMREWTINDDIRRARGIQKERGQIQIWSQVVSTDNSLEKVYKRLLLFINHRLKLWELFFFPNPMQGCGDGPHIIDYITIFTMLKQWVMSSANNVCSNGFGKWNSAQLCHQLSVLCWINILY